LLATAAIGVGVSGCCASPYRQWQNERGWNDPRPDCYGKGPPPPRTTPPGPMIPAAVPVTSAITGP
jgi:hypothetical protein